MSEVPDIKAVAEEYTAAAARGQRLCYFVCDTSLQQAEVANLDQMALKLRDAKLAAIHARDGSAANLFLGFEGLTRAIAWELRMWIAMKQHQPHDAWDALVEAQEHACVGLRTPAGHEGVAGYIERLHVLEETLFPPLQFSSVGLTYESSTCSICGNPFDSCSHVVGRIYGGRVCAEVELRGVKVDHAAVVKVPLDKHCYMAQYTKDGAWYDVMTRKETGEPPPEDDVFHTQGAIMSLNAPFGVNV